MSWSRAGRAVVAVGVAATTLVACSSDGGGGGGLRVVASTDVWGSVAKQVVGGVKGVDITSIITDPAADPHSYESDTRTALAVKQADVLIENGGGYDDFMSTLRSSTGTKATVLNAVQLSGKKPVDGYLNEHIWYDFPTVEKVAGDIATALGKADAKHAATFAANAKAFDAKLAAFETTEVSIKHSYQGMGAAITEPVPLYMLQACGLVNRTPRAFSEAVENGTDVSVSVLHETEQLFAGHRVALLAYNEQTTGAETTSVLAAAKAADVPIVPVTETLPAGKNYLTWMAANLAAIKAALAS